MKAFEMPRMEVVHLMREDIVRTSDWCNSHFCPDCVECDGAFTCYKFWCTKAYDNGGN